MQKNPKPTHSPTRAGMRSGTDCCTCVLAGSLIAPFAVRERVNIKSHFSRGSSPFKPLNPLAFTGDVKRPMNGDYFNFNILVKYRIKKEREIKREEGDKVLSFILKQLNFDFCERATLDKLVRSARRNLYSP